MKVLLHGPNPEAPYRTGGVATWMRHLVAIAERAGLEYEPLYLDPLGLARKRLPRRLVIAGGVSKASLRTLASWRARPTTLLHVNTSIYPSVAYRDGPVVAAARSVGLPVLLQVHGGRLSGLAAGSPSRALWSRIFAAATVIGVYPGPQWAEFERTAFAPRLRPMHNAVPESQAGPPCDVDPPRILFLGGLTRAKGVGRLLDAFIRLRETSPDATLAIAGRGPMEAELRERVADAGLAGAVHVTGFVTGEPLAKLMERCNIFVLPSRAEGFPLSFLECAERGMACLVTRNSAVPELFEDDREFVGLEPDDTADLLDPLRSVADDAARRAAIGRAAQAKVRDRFTISAMAGPYRRLCEDIMLLDSPRTK